MEYEGEANDDVTHGREAEEEEEGCVEGEGDGTDDMSDGREAEPQVLREGRTQITQRTQRSQRT